VGLGQSFDLLCACRRGSNQDGRSTGWTAGVGVDYAITESAVARIEYRYTNRVPISDLRAGIAYKFGARSDTIKF
jgi:opacity protein-like surface antigen